jgi:subtilisin family serine protease
MQNVQILPVKVIASAPTGPVRPQSVDPTPLPSAPAPTERTLRWAAGFTDLIARGMLYAIRNGAQVANLSMAWPQNADSPLMRQMIALAQARGMIIVASAGNDSTDARVMPCVYPGVICVASHGPDGGFSHFSNYGAFVDIAAPGLSILEVPGQLDRGAGHQVHIDLGDLAAGEERHVLVKVAVDAAAVLADGVGFAAPELVYRQAGTQTESLVAHRADAFRLLPSTDLAAVN